VDSVAELSPNRRYDHVFAIIRADPFEHSGATPAEAITITKVVWSREAAEAEASRLNHLNKDKGAAYFWRVTRLERRTDAQGAAD
jgi:hypothetical protein